MKDNNRKETERLVSRRAWTFLYLIFYICVTLVFVLCVIMQSFTRVREFSKIRMRSRHRTMVRSTPRAPRIARYFNICLVDARDAHLERFSIFRDYVAATNCANICDSLPLSTNSVSRVAQACARPTSTALRYVCSTLAGKIVNFRHDTQKHRFSRWDEIFASHPGE